MRRRQIDQPWRVNTGRKTGTEQTDHGSESAAYIHVRTILNGDTRDLIRIDIEWHDWQTRRWVPYETLNRTGDPA